MKQFHWLLCVAENCDWSRKITPLSNHREHTILLSRERVNKGKKRMKSLPLSPLVISFILRDFTGKTGAYKSCVNTEAVNSYLNKAFLRSLKVLLFV